MSKRPEKIVNENLPLNTNIGSTGNGGMEIENPSKPSENRVNKNEEMLDENEE
jgi:hypothetical protein